MVLYGIYKNRLARMLPAVTSNAIGASYNENTALHMTSQKPMTRKIVVIGGGPAGIEAARAAAEAGARVTLISDGPLGGRAGWDSLIPSKVWLQVADLLDELQHANTIDLISSARPGVVPAAVLARIKTVAAAWSAQQERELRDLGVTIVRGVASFVDANTIDLSAGEAVAPTRLEADAVIIASGSQPRFPPTMRPDGVQVLAPRFASKIEQLPPDIIVVGGGATGCEFTYLFNRLGVRVTWILDPSGVLPMFAPDVGKRLAASFVERGVDLQIGAPVERIEHENGSVAVVTAEGMRYRSARAFLAVGRIPDLGRLNLDRAGLLPDGNSVLSVDGYGRTAVRQIYVVGDTVGGPMLANRAMAQAWVAGRHAAGASVAAYRPEAVIHAIYTTPRIAQVGTVSGPPDVLQTVRVPFSAVLKAHLSQAGDGFLDLAYDPWSGRVRGAVAIGPHADDVLAPVALALQMGASFEDLAAVFAAHPSISELAFVAAREALVRQPV